MIVLAGNMSSITCSRLQFRVFTIAWMKRSTIRFCLNERDCSSSSMPVRYIPKKNSKSVDQRTESFHRTGAENGTLGGSSGGVRSFGFDEKDKIRQPMKKETSFFDSPSQEFEEENSLSLGMESHEFMEEPEDFAAETGYLQEKDIVDENMKVEKNMQDAEKTAIGFLAARAFTAVELRKKLLGKRFHPDVVEALISNFQQRGLINDSLYAETFSRSRWSSLSWGPRRIKQALYNKGVSNDDAEKAVKIVFQDDEPGNEDSKLSLSKLSMNHLLEQASKQWNRGQDVSKETRKSRIIRWLQYRGFNWDIINEILRKLESRQSP